MDLMGGGDQREVLWAAVFSQPNVLHLKHKWFSRWPFTFTFCPQSYSYSCVRVGYSTGGGVQQLGCCPEWSYFQFPGGWGCLQQQHQPPAHRCSASPPHPGLRSCRQTETTVREFFKKKGVLKIKRGSSLSLQLGLLYYWLEIHFWCVVLWFYFRGILEKDVADTKYGKEREFFLLQIEVYSDKRKNQLLLSRHSQ